jgi:hypothetical protein
MSNDCAQRVMWGFGIGGGLGASIGVIRPLMQLHDTPALGTHLSPQPAVAHLVISAGALYGTYGAFKLRVCT